MNTISNIPSSCVHYLPAGFGDALGGRHYHAGLRLDRGAGELACVPGPFGAEKFVLEP